MIVTGAIAHVYSDRTTAMVEFDSPYLDATYGIITKSTEGVERLVNFDVGVVVKMDSEKMNVRRTEPHRPYLEIKRLVFDDATP